MFVNVVEISLRVCAISLFSSLLCSLLLASSMNSFSMKVLCMRVVVVVFSGAFCWFCCRCELVF